MAKKVFIAMSGGVDSSVAALLLKKRGYETIGVFMRCVNLDGCAERDAEDARRVAGRLGIPFYVWDFEDEYRRKVVDYMIEGYRMGITPNPDVMCNREIKFGVFLSRALRAGADFVATGHYVSLRSISAEGRTSAQFSLYTAKDKNKDQSYFLWTLMQTQLARCLFPIGEYTKPEVRAIAKRAGLPTAEKKDSQGICFLGKIALADFLKQHIPEARGSVYDTAGNEIGEHSGAYFYTIGQREGIGNLRREKGSAFRAPFYVAEKDVRSNTIVVAEGGENPALYRKEIYLRDMNFIRQNIKKSREVFARVRYRQSLVKAELHINGGEYKLIFETPQKFVAPGQSAVFYAVTGEMLGGGIIL